MSDTNISLKLISQGYKKRPIQNAQVTLIQGDLDIKEESDDQGGVKFQNVSKSNKFYIVVSHRDLSESVIREYDLSGKDLSSEIEILVSSRHQRSQKWGVSALVVSVMALLLTIFAYWHSHSSTPQYHGFHSTVTNIESVNNKIDDLRVKDLERLSQGINSDIDVLISMGNKRAKKKEESEELQKKVQANPDTGESPDVADQSKKAVAAPQETIENTTDVEEADPDESTDVANQSKKAVATPQETIENTTTDDWLDSPHELQATIGELKKLHIALEILIKESKAAAKNSNVEEGNGIPLTEDASSKLTSLLTRLNSVVTPHQSTSFLWTEQPWLFIELLFWSLIGFLVGKVMEIGGYLFWNNYLVSGTWMHAGQLVAVPFLAAVGAIIIGQIELSINNDFKLNFDSPEALVILAFLLALNPWDLFTNLKNKGSNYINRIQ